MEDWNSGMMESWNDGRLADRQCESPEYLRMSLAAAMTLGFKNGLFYRDAKLYCINLLLTYEKGCVARCAYCGLSESRSGADPRKSFIRVSWPTFALEEITRRIADRQDGVKRICISMITRANAVVDTVAVCRRLRKAFDIPVSLLIAPSIIKKGDMSRLKEAGADKVGVAIDLATPTLFNTYRGRGVKGPHRWERYWSCLSDAIRVFGSGMAGAHFIVGMGETEAEMCSTMQDVHDMGGNTHLFSFYPEEGSQLRNCEPPPMDQYRRIQMARYVIDSDLGKASRFDYDGNCRIIEYGLARDCLDDLIASGEPFRTSGCTGYDGTVACNRPFANSRPGPEMRNYPFKPTDADIVRIRKQLSGR